MVDSERLCHYANSVQFQIPSIIPYLNSLKETYGFFVLKQRVKTRVLFLFLRQLSLLQILLLIKPDNFGWSYRNQYSDCFKMCQKSSMVNMQISWIGGHRYQLYVLGSINLGGNSCLNLLQAPLFVPDLIISTLMST